MKPVPNKIPPAERIASSSKVLASATGDLHTAVTDLSKVVSIIELTFSRLKVCVSVWYQTAGGTTEAGRYWRREIGYTQIRDKWQIALKSVSGADWEEFDDVDVWPFEQGPPWMQVESIGKLPDLIDELITRTKDTTKNIRKKTAEAKELVDALTSALAEPKSSS